MGARRKARALALQAIYEQDTVGHDAKVALERGISERPLAPATTAYARDLVAGVLANKPAIDAVIREKAPAWPLEQLAPVDRNILRLAIYEILFDNKVPVRAAINEAVEMAKLFGSESSPRFVNGVLGSVALIATKNSLEGE
ncbi:MAG TPA: transcription antitermination factor NusB [Dehalococcoidia bacterium]|nr:transcription antitermination factor NusB [Dehalococcoidia bacterium]HLB29014.1 transcription antitermination factor NusB [Dehalococcoidia bacterium]